MVIDVKMKKSENTYKLLLKLNQYFKYCFDVLNSCQTREQIENTTNWFTNIINRLQREYEIISSKISLAERIYLAEEIYERIDIMYKQWNDFISSHPAMQTKNDYTSVKGFSEAFNQE